jgi:hypothetical protein
MPQLGDSANLLLGLAPGWLGGRGAALPYAAAPNKALHAVDAPASIAKGAWGGMQLSFHSDVASLIDALFDYRVRPMRAMRGQLDLRASSLMLGAGQRRQAIEILAGLLGLAPAQLEAGNLILLQTTRVDAQLRHPLNEGGVGRPIHVDHYWTREGRHAVGRLRLARQANVGIDAEHAHVGCREAGRYIDYLYDYGSHYISGLQIGDKYFQVFVCQPHRYALLQRLWSPWIGQDDAGPSLQAFVNYLGEDWIVCAGRIASAANDAFGDDAWHVPGLPVGESLLAPILREARGLPGEWPPSQDGVPIGIEFNPHSPYMEPQRATAWQQMFQGAMLQRFGESASWRDEIAASASSSNANPAIRHAEHGAAKGGDIGELAGVRACGDDLFVSRLHVRGELSWTAQAGACLLALTLDAEPADGSLPRLRLRGGLSSQSRIVTRVLRGALLIEHTDGHREALFAGLRFAADAQGRPTVSGELSRPDAATLDRLHVPLLALLSEAEARWTRALADRERALAHAVRRDISWLLRIVSDSGVMRSDTAHPAFWNAFYKRAALLFLCGPGQPVAPMSTEWMQASNTLLFQLRLDRPADLPAAELAAIDQVLRALLEQAASAAAAPDKAAIAALDARLPQLEQARDHVALASQVLLDRADNTHETALVLLLSRLIPSREDQAQPPSTPDGHSDEHLAQAMALLDRAERGHQLSRLLNELSNDTTCSVIDTSLARLEDADPFGLARTQWCELSADVLKVLEPLMPADVGGTEALRVSLQAYAALGSELAPLITSLQWQWRAYHRAHWSPDFAEPTSILERIHMGACRLDSLLAGMMFSQARQRADSVDAVETAQCLQ